MEKVFVLFQWGYDHFHRDFVGVFATREAAEKHAQKVHGVVDDSSTSPGEYNVEEEQVCL